VVAGVLGGRDEVVDGAGPGEGHGEGVAAGDAEAFAVVGIARARVEEHGRGAEGRRVPEHGAHVVQVVHLLAQHDGAFAFDGRQKVARRHGRELAAAAQDSSVEVESNGRL